MGLLGREDGDSLASRRAVESGRTRDLVRSAGGFLRSRTAVQAERAAQYETVPRERDGRPIYAELSWRGSSRDGPSSKRRRGPVMVYRDESIPSLRRTGRRVSCRTKIVHSLTEHRHGTPSGPHIKNLKRETTFTQLKSPAMLAGQLLA